MSDGLDEVMEAGAERAFALLNAADPAVLAAAAFALRRAGHRRVQTWSPKVFIPLTRLCRDRCHYCTFARPPRPGERAFLSRDEVLAIARAGRETGCSEALFTLGDKPEARFSQARTELAALGHATTISYLAEMCAAVRDETGLLPHVNAGVMGRDDLALLRRVSASQGLMLETLADRLGDPGMPHHRSPDKLPAARLETIRLAGEMAIPFTTGILIGIGETRAERVAALIAIRDLNVRHGHIHEVIVQNFRAKARTPMASAPEPDLAELVWSIAAARLILGPGMNIQAPPNLSAGDLAALLAAGINDWGGVSPVTPDHVNPEAPWPEVARLREVTEAAGLSLVARLPLYPKQVLTPARWLDPAMQTPVLVASDASGGARADGWSPGRPLATPMMVASRTLDPELAAICSRAMDGEGLGEDEIIALFAARDGNVEQICDAADQLRRQVVGDEVTYVVNRNINYTNICSYSCGFCAFSKGKKAVTLRGPAYDLDHGEVLRRVIEARERGATEVCLQGGIHPRYTGDTYLGLTRTIRTQVPEIHIHSFSPLEIDQGAATLGVDVETFLRRLRTAGLDTLPGTAAEILDDEVRAVICPDKLSTARWLEVVETAHRVGFKTTATIMFGHVDTPRHWARHLIRIRDLQARTGGFTEFVPLPFVPMETPIALKGRSRLGPTWREVRLMHAVARLALHPFFPSIQTSWVKLGAAGAGPCLNGGANDLGGTLMDESISRAAGAAHGQEMSPEAMESLIFSLGRRPRQRTTLYAPVDAATQARGRGAAPLARDTPGTPPVRKRQTAELDHAL